MWWAEIAAQAAASFDRPPAGMLHIDESAEVSSEARIDTTMGPVLIGPRTRVSLSP